MYYNYSEIQVLIDRKSKFIPAFSGNSFTIDLGEAASWRARFSFVILPGKSCNVLYHLCSSFRKENRLWLYMGNIHHGSPRTIDEVSYIHFVEYMYFYFPFMRDILNLIIAISFTLYFIFFIPCQGVAAPLTTGDETTYFIILALCVC